MTHSGFWYRLLKTSYILLALAGMALPSALVIPNGALAGSRASLPEQNGGKIERQRLGRGNEGIAVLKNTGDTDAAFGPCAKSREEQKMKIHVTDGTHTAVFELNGSPAAKSLYDQLPLTIAVENYSNDEKIFYPKKLDTAKPINANAKKGTLAYFSPWGDVVMFYRDFGSYNGLYELGRAVSGADDIEHLSGTITITKE